MASAPGVFTCGICLDNCKDPVTAKCGQHNFCLACLASHIRHRLPNPKCPTCNTEIQKDASLLKINIALRDAIQAHSSALPAPPAPSRSPELAASAEQQLSALGVTVADMLALGKLDTLVRMGCTVAQLLKAGVNLAVLRQKGYLLEDLLQLNMPAPELLRAGFTVQQLLDSGMSIRTLLSKMPAPDLLRAGITVQQLLDSGMNIPTMLRHGVSITTIRHHKAGAKMSFRDLREAGVSASQLLNSYKDTPRTSYKEPFGRGPDDIYTMSRSNRSVVDIAVKLMRLGGYTCDEVVAAAAHAFQWKDNLEQSRLRLPKWPCRVFIEMGASAESLLPVAAGFKDGASEMCRAGIKVAEMKAAGFSASQLRVAGTKAEDIIAAGFGLGPLLAAQVDLISLKASGRFHVGALRAAGFSPAQFRAAGYPLKQLKHHILMCRTAASPPGETEWSAQSVEEAGYKLQEFREAGFQARQLQEAGFSAREVFPAGYSQQECRAAYPHLEAVFGWDL